MALLRVAVFLFLSLFAMTLRARPFAWEGAPLSARVGAGNAALRARNVWKPEGAGDVLVTVVHAKAGDKGLSLLALLLFGAAVFSSLDAAAGLAGFGPAALLAVPFFPLAMGDSGPDPWLFSALFTALFLQTMARVRLRSWPAWTLAFLPAIAALWPLFHEAGVLLAPFLALLTVADGLMSWWAAENAVQGGVFTGSPDPLLFKEEELDMPVFLRVLSWETKTNQFLHQRLEMTPDQLKSLTAGRAVEVLNGLLNVPDLPEQIGVPDPGPAGAEVRERNRRLLELQYRDALRAPAAPSAAGGDVPLPPLPLWVPLSAALVAFAAVAVPPAGPQALGRLFTSLSDAGGLLSVPSDWWISAPRTQYPAAPYFWAALGLFIAAGLAGMAKARDKFSPVFFLGGLALFTVLLPAPASAPFVATAALVFAAAGLRSLQGPETPVRALSFTAALIVLLVALFFADWDHLPLGMSLGLGALEPAAGAG